VCLKGRNDGSSVKIVRFVWRSSYLDWFWKWSGIC